MKTGLKSFSKNTFIYSIGTIALRFTTFLLIPLYTNYLTKSEFGLLQTLFFTIQVIITINDLGLRSAIVRYFSEYMSKNKLSNLLGSSIIIIMLASGLLFLISFIIPDNLIAELFQINVIPNLVLYTLTAAIFQTLSLNILSYFRAYEKSIQYMTISLSTSLLLIILTFISLAVFNLGIKGVLIAQSISFGIMWCTTVIWIVIKQGLKFDTNVIIKLLKFGVPLVFAMSGDLIINTYGSYQLGSHSGLEEVAIFSLAYKISIIAVMVLIGPFQMAYEPYVFKNKDNPNLQSTISQISVYAFLMFTFISIVILIVFRDFIKIIAGSEYLDSYLYIFLLLPGIGSTLFNYIGQSLLHINNKTQITGTIVLLTTLLSIASTYFLINIWGIFGFVVSINFYLITSSLLIFYFGIKDFPMSIDHKRLVKLTFISFLTYIYIYLISELNSFMFYSLSILLALVLFSWIKYSHFFTKHEKDRIGSFVKELRTRFI